MVNGKLIVQQKYDLVEEDMAAGEGYVEKEVAVGQHSFPGWRIATLIRHFRGRLSLRNGYDS